MVVERSIGLYTRCVTELKERFRALSALEVDIFHAESIAAFQLSLFTEGHCRTIAFRRTYAHLCTFEIQGIANRIGTSCLQVVPSHILLHWYWIFHKILIQVRSCRNSGICSLSTCTSSEKCQHTKK